MDNPDYAGGSVCCVFPVYGQCLSFGGIWNDLSNNEDAFGVEYQINSNGWVPLSNNLPNTTSRDFTRSDVIEGDTIKFQVKALNDVYESGYSSDLFGATVRLVPFAPTAPTITFLSSTETTATLRAGWIDNSNNEMLPLSKWS